MSFTLHDDTAAPVAAPEASAVPAVAAPSAEPSKGFTLSNDPEAQHDASDYEAPTSFKEKFQGAREVVAQQGSGLVAGAAGLVGEAGSVLARQVPDSIAKILPKPLQMGIKAAKAVDPNDVKGAIQQRMTYKPKTPAGKKYADFINSPESLANPLTYVKAIGDFGESLKGMTEDPDTKAEIDLLFNAALTKAPGIPKAMGAGVKGVLRGGEAARVKMGENLAAFKRSGVDEPSLGQVSEGGVTKGAGGGEDVVAKQQPQVAGQAERLSDKLSAAKTSEEAGTAIQVAIEGKPKTELLTPHKKTIESPLGTNEGGWIHDVGDKEGQLHAKWQRMVGEQTPVFLKATLSKLKEMTTPIAGAMSTTAGFMNKRLLDIRSRMIDDVGNAKSMPLDAIEKVRRDIGELTDPRLDAPLSAGQANALYASIKTDVGEMVARKGDKAKAAYNDAFEYSRKKNEIIEGLMEPLRKAGTPEKAFGFAMTGTADGASRLRMLFEGDPKAGVKGLNPAERDVVKAVALRKLGEADSGEFNPIAFETNWNRMHNDAKDLLFGKVGTNRRNSLEALNQVMLKTKSTSTTLYEMRNYAVEHNILGGVTGVVALAGHHGIASVLLGFLSGGYVAGRLITRPWFIKWLASASAKKPASLGPMLVVLGRQAAEQSSEDQQDAQAYTDSIKNFDPKGKP